MQLSTPSKTITCTGRFQVNDSNGNTHFLENTRQSNPVYTETLQNQDPNVNSFWVIETTGTSAAIQSQLYKVVGMKKMKISNTQLLEFYIMNLNMQQ